ncbi:MAG: PadR family transcriptional regulator [bacterium]|nr:PadR family transcriptional regulator [bacterium]
MKYLSRPEEMVLLTIHRLNEEAYGMNIKSTVSELTGKYWSIGSIYVPLDRLEQKGFVNSYLANPTPERGGKSKRYYSLTETGMKELQEIKKVYSAFWDGLPDLSI